MDYLTKRALQASIAKWERNMQAERPEDILVRSEDCPLCHLFYAKDCQGCPIRERTGEQYCRDTPYMEVHDARYEAMLGEHGQFTAALEACVDEVNFLKSLLPEASQ